MLQTYSYQEITCARTTVSLAGQQLHVLVYAVDGMLLDTGPSRMGKKLIPFFDQIKPKQVVLTHHHEDHTGLAAWLQKNRGLPVFIHETGIPVCQQAAKLPLYRTLFWGKRDAFQPQPLESVVQTEKYSFQVIHTPGHAFDHIALFNEEKGWLFSGDAYITSRPKTIMRSESVAQMMDSLRNLLSFEFSTMFCAHAGVVENGKAKLAAKLAFLEEIKGEVLALHAKGYTPDAICKKLYPQKYPITYLSGFEMSPKHIVTSIIGNG
jgi:ribonuclease/clavin/mitogillin